MIDKLVRTEDGWKIRKRVVLRDWTISFPLDRDWVMATNLKPGQRSNADHSYVALRRVHGDPVKATVDA